MLTGLKFLQVPDIVKGVLWGAPVKKSHPVGLEIQKYRNTELQKYRNTEIQTYRNTEIMKYRNNETKK